MKILQMSTPFLPVSPHLKYGGSERIVYLLDSGLNKFGLSAGVVAPKDSEPQSNLFSTIEESCGVGDVLDRTHGTKYNALYDRLGHIASCLNYSKDLNYDIIHLHDDNLLAFHEHYKKPSLLTLHSDIDGFWAKPENGLENCRTKLIAISQSQRKIYEKAGFQISDVVYNGVDEDLFRLAEHKEKYLLSLGSISPVKGQDTAIEVAKRSGDDLIIAGKIGDQKYFNSKIKPNITHDLSEEEDKLEAFQSLSLTVCPKVVFVGPVNDTQKAPLYSHAKAFLMPIRWEEPFGLVMVEAMLSGTPVIAFNKGSIPEIINEGRTGYIVDDILEMISSLNKMKKIDPEECRKIAKERFGKEQMVRNYIHIYEKLLQAQEMVSGG